MALFVPESTVTLQGSSPIPSLISGAVSEHWCVTLCVPDSGGHYFPNANLPTDLLREFPVSLCIGFTRTEEDESAVVRRTSEARAKHPGKRLSGHSLEDNSKEVLREVLIQASRIARDICPAVEQCHARGIIHRDIKPSNIIVTESGELRLIDFDVAAPRGARSMRPGHEDVRIGTLPAGSVITARNGSFEFMRVLPADFPLGTVDVVDASIRGVPVTALIGLPHATGGHDQLHPEVGGRGAGTAAGGGGAARHPARPGAGHRHRTSKLLRESYGPRCFFGRAARRKSAIEI